MTRHAIGTMAGRHGHHTKGERHANARFSEAQIMDIRQKHAAGWSMRAIGREYGVYHGTIRKIVMRVTWKHLD